MSLPCIQPIGPLAIAIEEGERGGCQRECQQWPRQVACEETIRRVSCRDARKPVEATGMGWLHDARRARGICRNNVGTGMAGMSPERGTLPSEAAPATAMYGSAPDMWLHGFAGLAAPALGSAASVLLATVSRLIGAAPFARTEPR